LEQITYIRIRLLFQKCVTLVGVSPVFENAHIISPWPKTIFASSNYYEYWLTGINEFYLPNENWFAIPATITQIPFFHEEYPSAINYGGLGSVIGHEITHGFDPEV